MSCSMDYYSHVPVYSLYTTHAVYHAARVALARTFGDHRNDQALIMAHGSSAETA